MTDVFTQLVEKLGEIWSQVQVWLPASGTAIAAFIFAAIKYAYKCIVESGAIKLLKSENTSLKETNEKLKTDIASLAEKVSYLTDVSETIVVNTINPTVRETCSALIDLAKNNDIIDVTEDEEETTTEESTTTEATSSTSGASASTSGTNSTSGATTSASGTTSGTSSTSGVTSSTSGTDPSVVGFVGD